MAHYSETLKTTIATQAQEIADLREALKQARIHFGQAAKFQGLGNDYAQCSEILLHLETIEQTPQLAADARADAALASEYRCRRLEAMVQDLAKDWTPEGYEMMNALRAEVRAEGIPMVTLPDGSLQVQG